LKILLDNDIVIKLANLDLIVPFTSLPRVKDAEVACLASLPYRLAKKPLEVHAQTRGVAFVSSCRKLDRAYLAELAIDLDSQELLSTCPGIDAGEAQLLSAALAAPDAVVLTGDKRCLKAFCQSSVTTPMAQKLQGRVVILEQLIIEIIGAIGFDDVKTRALSGVHCDTAIRASFGSGSKAEEGNVISTLRSYVREVDNCCPGILAPTDILIRET
jgi:hypothetical protein